MPNFVTPIQPIPINIGEVIKAIDGGLFATLASVEADYVVATGTWEADNIPEWEQKGPETKGGSRVLEYKTHSVPFIWVDEGTEGPYPIRAKNAEFLAFTTGWTPKTIPGRLAAGPGSSGTDWHFMKEVEHPGIESRRTTEQVSEAANKVIDINIQNKLDEVESL